MPAGRHKSVAKRARKAHAKRPTKHQRPLTSRQKAKVESAIGIAKGEAKRYAIIYGITGRIDELRSLTMMALLHAARNHVAAKSPWEAFVRLVIRRKMDDWAGKELLRCPQSDDDPRERIDPSPSPAEQAEASECAARMAERMAEAMKSLSHFDRDILERCVVAGERMEDVGAIYGCSDGRICQLKAEAVEKLKRAYMEQVYGPLPDLFNQAA